MANYTKTAIPSVSDVTRNAIKAKSANALPNDPSANRMKGDTVKKHFYNYVTDSEGSSVINEINRINNATQTKIDGLIDKVNENTNTDGSESFDGKNVVQSLEHLQTQVNTLQGASIDNQGLTTALSNYATTASLGIYATNADLEGYYTKTEIDNKEKSISVRLAQTCDITNLDGYTGTFDFDLEKLYSYYGKTNYSFYLQYTDEGDSDVEHYIYLYDYKVRTSADNGYESLTYYYLTATDGVYTATLSQEGTSKTLSIKKDSLKKDFLNDEALTSVNLLNQDLFEKLHFDNTGNSNIYYCPSIDIFESGSYDNVLMQTLYCGAYELGVNGTYSKSFTIANDTNCRVRIGMNGNLSDNKCYIDNFSLKAGTYYVKITISNFTVGSGGATCDISNLQISKYNIDYQAYNGGAIVHKKDLDVSLDTINTSINELRPQVLTSNDVNSISVTGNGIYSVSVFETADNDPEDWLSLTSIIHLDNIYASETYGTPLQTYGNNVCKVCAVYNNSSSNYIISLEKTTTNRNYRMSKVVKLCAL